MTQLSQSNLVHVIITVKEGRPICLGVYKFKFQAYAELRKLRRTAPFLNAVMDTGKFYA